MRQRQSQPVGQGGPVADAAFPRQFVAEELFAAHFHRPGAVRERQGHPREQEAAPNPVPSLPGSGGGGGSGGASWEGAGRKRGPSAGPASSPALLGADRRWLASLFAKPALDALDRKALLSGKSPAGVEDCGRTVCA